MDVDLESMCRLCASKNGFKVNLFEKRLGYIDKIKRFIPSLKIPQDDKLPSMICFRCAMLIGDFEKFCLNCVQVQETFLKMKDDQTLSLSEKHTDREPKSNNNGDDDDDDDDDAANLNDHDSDHESGVNNRESNDSSTESNIETESRSTEKRIKKRRVSKNGTPIGDKHPPRDDENSHEATASGVNGEKPKHMKETAIPLPELGSCQLIYTCDYCNQSFLTKSVAYSHVCDNMMNNCKRDDVGERSNSYTCELCYQVFSRQAVLQAHRVGHMHESSGEGSGDEVYDEDACVFGQKRRKKRRGGRVTRDGLDYTPFFQENDQETE